MDPQDDIPEENALISRAPALEDLVALCRELNAQGAKYVIVGGICGDFCRVSAVDCGS